jgi:predicted restriction endonuclease
MPGQARRPKIPRKIETEVLVRSRRRCCLCVFLDNDFSVKHVQIAHLDHDRTNNKIDNLTPLCLFHHDEYDISRVRASV